MTSQDSFPVRTVDMVALKALAHPLRISILELLSRHGSLTAAGLAELLDESTGSTSYHLRQLAKHDFVVEVEGKGTARERWWERPKGALEISTRDLAENPASREAARIVAAGFEESRAAALHDFLLHGYDVLPAEWTDAATISTTNARLTADQLTSYVESMERFSRQLLEELRAGGEQDGSRPVQLHLNAFPLISPIRIASNAKERS
jgi:DNA-binding transcriptional ArsR family regulator